MLQDKFSLIFYLDRQEKKPKRTPTQQEQLSLYSYKLLEMESASVHMACDMGHRLVVDGRMTLGLMDILVEIGTSSSTSTGSNW